MVSYCMRFLKFCNIFYVFYNIFNMFYNILLHHLTDTSDEEFLEACEVLEKSFAPKLSGVAPVTFEKNATSPGTSKSSRTGKSNITKIVTNGNI
jgi:hypothetical protein